MYLMGEWMVISLSKFGNLGFFVSILSCKRYINDLNTCYELNFVSSQNYCWKRNNIAVQIMKQTKKQFRSLAEMRLEFRICEICLTNNKYVTLKLCDHLLCTACQFTWMVSYIFVFDVMIYIQLSVFVFPQTEHINYPFYQSQVTGIETLDIDYLFRKSVMVKFLCPLMGQAWV